MHDGAVAASEPVSEVASAMMLEGLLQPSLAAPEYERKLQPLAGVRWPQGERRTAVAGEVAMFDVTDPGVLQDW